ncbi:MAG: cytidine deaminase [Aureispira sp.]
MKKIILQTEIQEAANIEELSTIDAQLLTEAKAAAEVAYAPYSKFRVGAAALLANGKIVRGCNQENAAYPVTLCGERVALFSAAAQYPDTPVVALAITVKSAKGNVDRPLPPCGSCRQVIFESERRHQQSIRLILQGDSGVIYCIDSVKDILPLVFDSSYLE